MNALFAFLHHLAAFSLVAALAVEFVLLREELTPRTAQRILIADTIYGASAGAILVVGLLRVFHFEKGWAYYGHNLPFMIKMSLFAMVGLLSVYPTVEFLSWRKLLRAGAAPRLDALKQRRLRKVVHWELAGIVFILLSAALMARGYGQLG